MSDKTDTAGTAHREALPSGASAAGGEQKPSERPSFQQLIAEYKKDLARVKKQWGEFREVMRNGSGIIDDREVSVEDLETLLFTAASLYSYVAERSAEINSRTLMYEVIKKQSESASFLDSKEGRSAEAAKNLAVVNTRRQSMEYASWMGLLGEFRAIRDGFEKMIDVLRQIGYQRNKEWSALGRQN